MSTTQLDPKQPDFELIPKSPADVAKAIAYSVVAVAVALIPITADDVVSNPELLILAVAVLGILGVYWLRGTIAKVSIAFAVAGLQALALVITDLNPGFGQVTTTQWLVVLVTAASAIGVGFIPNGGAAGLIKASKRDGRHEFGVPLVVELSTADRQRLADSGHFGIDQS